MERWQDIDGFYGYAVSTEGRVSSRKDYRGCITNTSHILKPRVNPNGYAIVTLYDDHRKPHQLSVHRLVAKTFMPVLNDSLVVDHLDGNKLNNSLSNLEWVTGKENSVRACRAGLYEPAFEITRRPVIVTNLWTGEETYFDSVNEAARQLGYSPAIISKVANMHCDKVEHYTIEFADFEDRLLFKEYF